MNISQPVKRKSGWPTGTIVLVILAGIATMVWAANKIQQDRNSLPSIPPPPDGLNIDLQNNQTPVINYLPPPPPPPVTTTIANTTFALEPNQYRWYTVEIPYNAVSANLYGSFEAQGGSGNDIKVMITDDIGLTNYKNGHEAKGWYHSGTVTTDRFDVSLAAGKYHVIYRNPAIFFSNKVVKTEIYLKCSY